MEHLYQQCFDTYKNTYKNNFNLMLGNVDLNCLRLLFMIYCWRFMRTFFQEIVVISSLFSLINILRPTRPAAFAALDSPSGSRTTLGPMFSDPLPAIQSALGSNVRRRTDGNLLWIDPPLHNCRHMRTSLDWEITPTSIKTFLCCTQGSDYLI